MFKYFISLIIIFPIFDLIFAYCVLLYRILYRNVLTVKVLNQFFVFIVLPFVIKNKKMKNCYIFGLLSILIVGIAAQPLSDGVDGIIEDILNQKLEEFRAMMKTGNPDLGIPVLAPFESDRFPNSFSFGGIIEWVEKEFPVPTFVTYFKITIHMSKLIPLSIFIQKFTDFSLSSSPPIQLERRIHQSTNWQSWHLYQP